MGKVDEYINRWKSQGYITDIPDELPECLEFGNMAPSYKKLCLAILKNDHTFKSLGMAQPRSEVYSAIKRAEIKQRRDRPDEYLDEIFRDGAQLEADTDVKKLETGE